LINQGLSDTKSLSAKSVVRLPASSTGMTITETVRMDTRVAGFPPIVGVLLSPFGLVYNKITELPRVLPKLRSATA